MTANLVEVFSSVQGEGPNVGETTLFVRFGECDLRCRWCDSPHTWKPAAECRLEQERASGRFRRVANPVALDTLLATAQALDVAAHRFVSLTGGEPLLQPEAVRSIAEALGHGGPRVLLETHGLATAALLRVGDAVDVVSMDWKLPSDVRRESEPRGRPGAPFDAEHEAFLARARAAAHLVVKLVVTPSSTDEELDRAFAALARSAPGATLVLQPVTPFGQVRERPTAARMLELARRAEALLRDVRVIPQTHPIYGAP